MKTINESVKTQTRLHDVADILKTLSEWCDLELARVSAVGELCNRLQKENEELKAELKRVYAGEMRSFWTQYDEKKKEVERLHKENIDLASDIAEILQKYHEKKEEVEKLIKEREDLRAELVTASTGMLYRSWIDSDEHAKKYCNMEIENENLKKEVERLQKDKEDQRAHLGQAYKDNLRIVDAVGTANKDLKKEVERFHKLNTDLGADLVRVLAINAEITATKEDSGKTSGGNVDP